MKTVIITPLFFVSTVAAFSRSFTLKKVQVSNFKKVPQCISNLKAATGSVEKPTADNDVLSTVFDFTETEEDTTKSVNSFERIDDAVMGGISLSALKDVENKPYASWSGVCRTDGGGFCGMRTLPFVEPLSVIDKDGVFIDCRLMSDNEPERRVWKITLRSDSSRGEQVYQASLQIPKRLKDDISLGDNDGWNRIKIPFESFQLVRGPRLVIGGPKFNTTAGLFQIGASLSKFVIGVNTTELENFRPGYFDLHLQRLGFYEKDTEMTMMKNIDTPDTLTKEESNKKKPLLLKLLLPVARILFSEKANRRRSAMNILTKKRGLNRLQAILYGVRSRTKSIGYLPSLAKTLSIIAIDMFRFAISGILKVCLLYPLKLFRMLVKKIKNLKQ